MSVFKTLKQNIGICAICYRENQVLYVYTEAHLYRPWDIYFICEKCKDYPKQNMMLYQQLKRYQNRIIYNNPNTSASSSWPHTLPTSQSWD